MNFRDIPLNGIWFGGSKSGGMEAREEAREGGQQERMGLDSGVGEGAGGRDRRTPKGQDFVRSCRDNKIQTERSKAERWVPSSPSPTQTHSLIETPMCRTYGGVEMDAPQSQHTGTRPARTRIHSPARGGVLCQCTEQQTDGMPTIKGTWSAVVTRCKQRTACTLTRASSL